MHTILPLLPFTCMCACVLTMCARFEMRKEHLLHKKRVSKVFFSEQNQYLGILLRDVIASIDCHHLASCCLEVGYTWTKCLRYIPYSKKLLCEKTFVNWWKTRFSQENLHKQPQNLEIHDSFLLYGILRCPPSSGLALTLTGYHGNSMH